MNTFYHGLPKGVDPEDFCFSALDTHPEGIHLGTWEQAHMRAGGGAILEVSLLDSCRPRRIKDRDGSWCHTNKRAASQGVMALTYLNRHEGISVESALRLGDLGLKRAADLSDREFLKLAPEARDSIILLCPTLIYRSRIYRQ
jgi:hypothetical protein